MSYFFFFLLIVSNLFAQEFSTEFVQHVALQKENFLSTRMKELKSSSLLENYYRRFDKSRRPTVSSLASYMESLSAEGRTNLLNEIIDAKQVPTANIVYFFYKGDKENPIKLYLGDVGRLNNTLILVDLALRNNLPNSLYLKPHVDLKNDSVSFNALSLSEFHWELKTDSFKSWLERKKKELEAIAEAEWSPIEKELKSKELVRIAEEKRIAELKRIEEEKRLAEVRRLAIIKAAEDKKIEDMFNSLGGLPTLKSQKEKVADIIEFRKNNPDIQQNLERASDLYDAYQAHSLIKIDIDNKPRKIAFLIDYSGSVQGNPLATIKNELGMLMQLLPNN